MMLNGWSIPTIWVAVIAQATAAVWWASSTDQQVEQNSVKIEQVVTNEKHIAIVQVQQIEIIKDITDIKMDNKEIKNIVQEIRLMMTRWDNDSQ